MFQMCDKWMFPRLECEPRQAKLANHSTKLNFSKFMFGIIFRFSPFFLIKCYLLPTKNLHAYLYPPFLFCPSSGTHLPPSFLSGIKSRSPEGTLQFSSQEFWQGGVRDPKLSAAQKQARS